MATKVGFIGLGAMGAPLAKNLQKKGFDLNVFDIDAAKVEMLVALGARRAASVAEASRGADVVITILPATVHVEAVVLGLSLIHICPEYPAAWPRAGRLPGCGNAAPDGQAPCGQCLKSPAYQRPWRVSPYVLAGLRSCLTSSTLCCASWDFKITAA